MKQTVEEAAREAIYKHYNCNGEYPCGERNYCIYCNGHNAAFDCRECGADEFKEEFIAGTEWQQKQSQWINVEERYPSFDKDNNKYYLVRVSTGSIKQSIYYAVSPLVSRNRFGIEMDWTRVTHWMPIPSFYEILEMNKDVLQRMKEK